MDDNDEYTVDELTEMIDVFDVTLARGGHSLIDEIGLKEELLWCLQTRNTLLGVHV